MTAQDSAYSRLRRAIERRNTLVAWATAAELPHVELGDALALVLLALCGSQTSCPNARIALAAIDLVHAVLHQLDREIDERLGATGTDKLGAIRSMSPVQLFQAGVRAARPAPGHDRAHGHARAARFGACGGFAEIGVDSLMSSSYHRYIKIHR